jgi:hypothetical protein
MIAFTIYFAAFLAVFIAGVALGSYWQKWGF